MKNKIYPNLFKNRYECLKGKDWLKTVLPEDKKAFIEIGLIHAQNGHLGGLSRANSAQRDSRGRFITNR